MPSESIKVLLVEDNEEHVQFLTTLFQSTAEPHYALETVGSLQQGITAIAANQPQIILLDLSLPDSNGLETFIGIIDQARDIPIVVLSGINDVALAVETVQLGAQDYLVKGHVDNDLLIRSLQYAAERKRIQLQLKRASEETEKRVQDRTAALRNINERLELEIAERKKAEEAVLQSNRQLASALGKLKEAQDQPAACFAAARRYFRSTQC